MNIKHCRKDSTCVTAIFAFFCLIFTISPVSAQRFKDSYIPNTLSGAERAVFKSGMEAWSANKGKFGACMDCHSPDALDLAYIDVEKADFVRYNKKVNGNLSSSEIEDVFKLIELQRDRYNINKPKNRFTYRPLQPGKDGQPLCGDSPNERDENFADELEKFFPNILKTYPKSFAESKQLANKLVSLDARLLPSPIPFPLLVSDGQNDPKLGTVSEWVANISCKPASQDLNEARGKYIRTGTRDDFWKYYNAINADKNCFPLFTRFPNPIAKGFESNKYVALQLLQHSIREELTGVTGSKFITPPLSFLEYGKKYIEDFKDVNSLADIDNSRFSRLPGSEVFDMSGMNRKAKGFINWRAEKKNHSEYLKLNEWPQYSYSEADNSLSAGDINTSLMTTWNAVSFQFNDFRTYGLVFISQIYSGYNVFHAFKALQIDLQNKLLLKHRTGLIAPTVFGLRHRMFSLIGSVKYTAKQAKAIKMLSLNECSIGMHYGVNAFSKSKDEIEKIGDDNIYNVRYCIEFVRKYVNEENSYFTNLAKEWLSYADKSSKNSSSDSTSKRFSSSLAKLEKTINNLNNPEPEALKFSKHKDDFFHGVHDSPRCSKQPVPTPTTKPTHKPTLAPTRVPTLAPTKVPTIVKPTNTPLPVATPTKLPTIVPTLAPIATPTIAQPTPTATPAPVPTVVPPSDNAIGSVYEVGRRAYCLVLKGEKVGKLVKYRSSNDTYKDMRQSSVDRAIERSKSSRSRTAARYKKYADCIEGTLELVGGKEIKESNLHKRRSRRQRRRRKRRK